MRAILTSLFLAAAAAYPLPASALFDPPGFDATADQILAIADLDGDGVVTRGELDSATARFRHEATSQVEQNWRALLRLLGVDTAARRLDVADVGRGVIHLQRQADADGGGVASLDEIRSFLGRLAPEERKVTAELLAFADANADGAVDDKEIGVLKTRIEEFLTARLADEEEKGDALVERTSALTGWLLRAEACAETARVRFEHAAGGSGQVALRDLAGGPKRTAASAGIQR